MNSVKRAPSQQEAVVNDSFHRLSGENENFTAKYRIIVLKNALKKPQLLQNINAYVLHKLE